MLTASSEMLIQSSQQPSDTDTILVTALEMTMKRLNDLPKGLQLVSDRSRIPTRREIPDARFPRLATEKDQSGQLFKRRMPE